MKKIGGLLLLIVCLASCKKNCGIEHMIQGNYTGTFVRWQGKDGPVSHVKLTLSGSAFNGSSDSVYYPAICSGTFNTSSNPDSIHFVNTCAFPADFDWTFILNGSYKLVQTGDSLYIRRVIGDFVYEEDVYSLRRQ